MLDALRQSAGSWVAKIFIGLLVLSFAVWGIADVFNGLGQRTVLQVGDAEISAETFQLALNREMRSLGQRSQQPVTLQQARQIGLDRQVLSRMAVDAALDDRVQKMNLGISDEQLAKRISQDPNFQVLGGFNREFFNQILRSYGLTEDDFINDAEAFALRQQFAAALAGGMETPSALLNLANRYDNEQRTVDYITLTPDLVGDISDPDSATLEAYFEANQSTFSAPEYRGLAILTLNPEVLAAGQDVSDEELQAEYEANLPRYTDPERRSLEQLLFRDQESASSAQEALENGASFDDIAQDQSYGATLSNLNNVTQVEMVDETVAEAAFAIDEDTVSDIIDGRFGPVLIRVTEIDPAEIQPLSEVEDELRRAVLARNAETEVFNLYDAVEDARAGGSSLQEISDRFNLPLAQINAVSQQGFSPEGDQIGIPEAQTLLSNAFESDIGLENDPIQQGVTGFIWYDVTDIQPARERELDEVRDAVIAAWKAEQQQERLQQLAQDMASALNSNSSFEQAISQIFGQSTQTELVLETNSAEDGDGANTTTSVQNVSSNLPQVQTAAGFTRGEQPQGFDQSSILAAFETPVGEATHILAADGQSRLVIKVTDSTVPAIFDGSEEVEATRERLSQSLQDTLLTQYVAELQRELGVTINQQLFAQITGAPETQ
jgi:peptidyl-prolyl cis-trans isomerase D